MKILLPIDGSECSLKTLDWVIKTFGGSTPEFYLLNVIPISSDMIKVEYDVTDASKALKEAKSKLQAAGCKVFQASYVFGHVVDRICEYADEIEADQIVLGSHGRTGLNKILLGSTSIAVMERSCRPVTLYRNVERPALKQNQATLTARTAS